MPHANPFVEMTRARGAVMRDYAGVELPETFGDPLKECIDVRSAAGLFDLSFRTGLVFTGSDRATFLHNMLSNDITALAPGSGCYATLLTRESKIVADANVLCMEEGIRLDLGSWAERHDQAGAGGGIADAHKNTVTVVERLTGDIHLGGKSR